MSLSERQERILALSASSGRTRLSADHPRDRQGRGISSTSVVKYNLERLEEKGKLERSDEISRGLRLRTAFRDGRGERLVAAAEHPQLGLISAGARSRPRPAR